MPIKLSNINFFISKDRYSSVSRLGRFRGILRCHVRVAASSLFRVRPPGRLVAGVADAGAPRSATAATTHNTKFVFGSRREPQKSGQNIATKVPVVRIETRMSSHELAGGGAER